MDIIELTKYFNSNQNGNLFIIPTNNLFQLKIKSIISMLTKKIIKIIFIH